MTTVRGGYNIYGRSIGILMLQTQFPRIPGDMGNATSFAFPVVHRVVEGASPQRVVTGGDLMVLLEAVQLSLHRQPYRGYQR